IGVARDKATGHFVGHAIGVTGNQALGQVLGNVAGQVAQTSLLGMNPIAGLTGVVSVAQNHQIVGQNKHIIGQLGQVTRSLGVLQTSIGFIGVGTTANVALGAVSLWQIFKLRQDVEKLGSKIDKGFLDLTSLIQNQGQAIQEQLNRVADDIKFEQHRMELVKAYGQFSGAIELIKTGLSCDDESIRNADLANARSMLGKALSIYRNPNILGDVKAPGYLRRVECAWLIEYEIARSYSLQNQLGSSSQSLLTLEEHIREDGVEVIDRCETEAELDFVGPELLHIHDNDLAFLNVERNQLDWVRSLPPEDKEQLQSLEISNPPASDGELSEEELSELPAIAQYEEFKTKSHPLALCDQIRLMMKPQLRVNCIDYICDRAQQEGHRTLIPQYLNEASEFALANLFHYFQPRDDFPEEETEEIPSQPVARS
ncbi:MAG: hypothetical protein ACLFSH_17125, partial [Phormidium sp.]